MKTVFVKMGRRMHVTIFILIIFVSEMDLKWVNKKKNLFVKKAGEAFRLGEIIDASETHMGSALFLYFGVLVLVLSFVLLSLYIGYMRIDSRYVQLEKELVRWEKIVDIYPNSPDAFYNAAYFAANLGQKHEALRYVEEALYLDGNFEKARGLREEILSM